MVEVGVRETKLMCCYYSLSFSHIYGLVRVGSLVFVHHFNGCRTMGAFRFVQWFFFGWGMVWVGVDFHRCRNTRYVTSFFTVPPGAAPFLHRSSTHQKDQKTGAVLI